MGTRNAGLQGGEHVLSFLLVKYSTLRYLAILFMRPKFSVQFFGKNIFGMAKDQHVHVGFFRLRKTTMPQKNKKTSL